MQIDPETPELDEQKPQDESNTRFRIPLSGPQAWLWMTVVVLIFANVMFLFLSNTKTPVTDDAQQTLDKDADNFERLSFWQRLWSDENQDPAGRYSVYDGLAIDPDTKERAVSLMIDNHSLARDGHEGLRSASVVYEALVEGGITRIMLIFPYQELDRVGPVRSARDYFVDFAEEYGGLYVHAGGSPTALDKLWASDRVYSIEEDIAETGETYSFRNNDYDAPHNLFFDLLLTKEWADEKNYELEKTKKEWCFNSNDQSVSMTNDQNESSKDQKGAETSNTNIELRNKRESKMRNKSQITSHNDQESRVEGQESSDASELSTLDPGLQNVSLIELNFSYDETSSYYVQFQYDAEDDSYRRFYRAENREPHIDKGDNLQVAPKNLIVQVAPSFLIEGDEKERLEMQHVGSGDGFYYSKGKKTEITWEKETLSSVTNFFDVDGEELCVNPGQTWVAIVDAEELVLEDGEE